MGTHNICFGAKILKTITAIITLPGAMTSYSCDFNLNMQMMTYIPYLSSFHQDKKKKSILLSWDKEFKALNKCVLRLEVNPCHAE